MKGWYIGCVAVALLFCTGCRGGMDVSSVETPTPSYVESEAVDMGERIGPGTALVDGEVEVYTTKEGAEAERGDAFAGDAIDGEELSRYVTAPSIDGCLTLDTVLVEIIRADVDKDNNKVNIVLSGTWSGGKPKNNPDSDYGVVAKDSALPEISVNGVTLERRIDSLSPSEMSGTYLYSGVVLTDVDTVEVDIAGTVSKLRQTDVNTSDTATGTISGRGESMEESYTLQEFVDKVADRIARRVFSWNDKAGSIPD